MKQSQSQFSLSNKTIQSTEKVKFPFISPSSSIADKYQNPFYIPDDYEIFKIKEMDKQKNLKKRQQNKQKKIWEKGIKQTTGLTIGKLNEFVKKSEDQQEDLLGKLSIAEASKNAIKYRVRSKQPMYQFIEKKREMLLFQMLIDHKRQQINNFQELTRLHRKGSQQMLDQDMVSFNNYLNDNKNKAREAIKLAQKKARQKNDLAATIKEKHEVKADLTGKNTTKLQTLENLRKYKEFLDRLNPSNDGKNKKKKEMKKNQSQNKFNFDNYNTCIPLTPEMLELLEEDIKEEEFSEWFDNNDHLMKIFINLEERNLQLISQISESQQSVEQFRNKYQMKKQILDQKKIQLLNNKTQIIKQNDSINQQIEHLKIIKSNDDVGEKLISLRSQLERLYKENIAILGDKKDIIFSYDSIEILKDIEKKLQLQIRYLKEYRNQNPEKIKALQRQCITNKRKGKIDEEQKVQVLQKVEEEPRKQKRYGRPIVSKTLVRKKQKEQKIEQTIPIEQLQRRKYLT